MQFKQGTTVITADDQQLGTVDRVVLDPKTGEVTHLVIRQGFLFTEDKVVPTDMVIGASEEQVMLQARADELQDLPPFEETSYFSPGSDSSYDPQAAAGYAPSLYWYPPAGAAWAWGGWSYPGGVVGYPVPPYVVETERNIPDGTVALKEGAKVVSADDQQVGTVERIFTEQGQNRATHLLISQGLLFKEKKLIPTLWINEVTEDEVQLAVAARFLEDLPAYQE